MIKHPPKPNPEEQKRVRDAMSLGYAAFDITILLCIASLYLKSPHAPLPLNGSLILNLLAKYAGI